MKPERAPDPEPEPEPGISPEEKAAQIAEEIRRAETEKKASDQLEYAKSVFKTNKPSGRKRLQEVINKWPDTNAANEAAKLLK